jgi:uncharacterized SAM-binding protein YcdF (DUF218 family)
MTLDPEIRPLVETIWDYHRLGHALKKSDAIVVLCSHDRIVARYAAELWLAGWAPLLVFSGGLGVVTGRYWSVPEAEQFAAVAESMGVPREAMLLETESRNTGENVLFTRRLLDAKESGARSFVVVQKPYMERRSFATFRKVWPEAAIVVTSPPLSLDEYLAGYTGDPLTPDDAIAIMVGDLQRIRLYAERGFQIPQEIPDEVWRAYEALVAAGYDGYLVDR